ncbi:UDP-glycosyltransferase 83A1 [Linum perenne]
MMKLAHKLTHHGIDVTVANLEFIHRKIIPQQKSKDEKEDQIHGGIRLISLGGISSDSELSDPIVLTESVEKALPIQLRELLNTCSSSSSSDQQAISQQEHFNWVIADAFLPAAFTVAKEFGIKTAALWTASMENLALILRVPELIESGIIDENGSSPGFPEEVLKTVFQCCANVAASLPSFDFLLVNSFEELEPSACRLIPNIYPFLPIGPLVTNSNNSNLPGSFWSQDRTCLAWLDKHPLNSVIYVAFGSIVFFNQKQFEELATGLEMTGRPFFWVVRTNFVEGSGCFVSHCGWNSVLDGLWCGVPFLCWPYYVDQFHNKESVCEGWKVGLKLDAEGEIGLVTSSEIASKVEQLLNDDTIKGNVIRLRKIAIESVNEGGFSHHNFTSFIDNLCS